MIPREAMGVFKLTTARTSTGAGPWIPLRSACKEFSMQCKKNSTGTSNYTILLEGTLTTASTAPYTEISYTQADNNTVKRSTAGRAVTYIRHKVTVLNGPTKSIQAYAAAVPSP